MPYIWTEPDEVVSHLGVTVYNVYKDGFWDRGAYEFHYTTDVTENALDFDIRDLNSYRHSEDHAAILKRAIEHEEITAPADN